MRFLSVFVILISAAFAGGQAATVHVICHLRDGRVSSSSGVIISAIGDECEVLSVAHAGALDAQSVEIIFSSGRRAWSSGSQTNSARDLTLFKVPARADGWRKIGPSPAIGQQVIGFGYVPAGRLERRDGIIIGSQFLGSIGKTLVTSFPTTKGNSGGPIYDTAGRLVGIIVGSDEARGRIISTASILDVLGACRKRTIHVPPPFPPQAATAPPTQIPPSVSPAPVWKPHFPSPITTPAPPAVATENNMESLVRQSVPKIKIAIEGKDGKILQVISADKTGTITLPPIVFKVGENQKTVPLGGELILQEKPE